MATENRNMDTPLARRRQLRRDSTDAEASLWYHLRSRRLAGFKFRRQHPCGPFILDFFCTERNLAIELDGGQHFEPATQHRDARRTSYLVQCGITVMRFPTDLVFRNLEAVLAAISAALNVDNPDPLPACGSQSGRGKNSARSVSLLPRAQRAG